MQFESEMTPNQLPYYSMDLQSLQYQECDNLFHEIFEKSQDSLSASPKSTLKSVNLEVDSILDEVLSGHDMSSNPSSPYSTLSDDVIHHSPSSQISLAGNDHEPRLNDNDSFVEEENVVLSDYTNQIDMNRLSHSNKLLKIADTGEVYHIFLLDMPPTPEQEPPICKATPPPYVYPPSPSTSNSTVGSPMPDKKLHKRVQNKRSSKKYREKMKNKEASLFEAVDTLINKKRTIEIELAKTKAVNSFLVDQIREQFGPYL